MKNDWNAIVTAMAQGTAVAISGATSSGKCYQWDSEGRAVITPIAIVPEPQGRGIVVCGSTGNDVFVATDALKTPC